MRSVSWRIADGSTPERGLGRLPRSSSRGALRRRARRGRGDIFLTQFREFQDGEIVPGTRYRVERLIGVGGMGSVYEVEHVELGKRFVLKALLRELARRDDLVARLRNEWRALGRLEHPSIVNVTDAGTSTNGVPFYVMERLEGQTLASRLRSGEPLYAPDALRIAAAVLEGLSAAHEIGVIHRDVKPQNVFLVRGGVPKLLDFGVAKIADPSGVITARGIAIGTPRYMSPEQARGDALDGRSDIYAAGLILFEMIAGRGPFDDTRDANELLLAHITREAPRLSTFAVVAPELDALVASMLEKDPRARPENARSLAAALRRLSERYAITASTDAPTPHAGYRGQLPHGPVPEAPPTRPDGLASRSSTPDATTNEALVSTRDVTLQLETNEVLARAAVAEARDPTTLQRQVVELGPADTLVDPLTLAGSTTTDATLPLIERTEVLTAVPAAPAAEDDAPPTRTAVPAAAEAAQNLTPPPVVPASSPKPEPTPRLVFALAAAVLGLGALAVGAWLVLRGEPPASAHEDAPAKTVAAAASPSAATPAPTPTAPMATDAELPSAPAKVGAVPAPSASPATSPQVRPEVSAKSSAAAISASPSSAAPPPAPPAQPASRPAPAKAAAEPKAKPSASAAAAAPSARVAAPSRLRMPSSGL